MPKIVDKQEMQARIMDAAMACFTRLGYHAAKMTDVATQAGLAKGTLYLYFPSKEALTVALLDRYFQALGAGVAEMPMPQTLADFLANLRAALLPAPEQIGATRLFFDVLGPGFDLPQGRQIIGAFFDHLSAQYAQALAQLQAQGAVRTDLDAASAGAAIASMADGMIIHLALFAPQPPVYAARLDAAIAVLADGLRGC